MDEALLKTYHLFLLCQIKRFQSSFDDILSDKSIDELEEYLDELIKKEEANKKENKSWWNLFV